MAFALQARFVFPVDRPAIEHGVVTIEGQRITAIGSRAHEVEVTDLGDVALLPGLVNAHTHLEFSHLKQPLGQPGMRLVDWIRLVIAERGQAANRAEASIAAGVRESIAGGATSLGDIFCGPAQEYPHVAADITAFAEVIGFSRARAASAFEALRGRLRSSQARANVRLGISPHAPYTVSPALLMRLIALANECCFPVAMHVAESVEELELLHNGTGPFQELLEERSMWDAAAIPHHNRPLDYLRMLAEAPRALVIHGNYLAADERAFLAAHWDRMSLVYCPRTHAYFKHPPYPLVELLAAGVRVALGTDSLASNPDLDMLGEMRHVARSFPSISPQEVLRMGTLAGADALGRGDEAGSLKPGKLANLVAVPLADDSAKTADQALEVLMCGDARPSGVWVRGVQVD